MASRTFRLQKFETGTQIYPPQLSCFSSYVHLK
jgi:hypothetical protein